MLLLMRRGIDSLLTRELVELRARRGDLTGLADATDARSLARQRRLLAVATFCFWLLLLVIPALTPWPAVLYALYALLWVLPQGRRPPA